jgi:hypothetical protein
VRLGLPDASGEVHVLVTKRPRIHVFREEEQTSQIGAATFALDPIGGNIGATIAHSPLASPQPSRITFNQDAPNHLFDQAA